MTNARHFLAPLGVGERLLDWGIDAARVRQLDWWQETELDGLRFALTPGVAWATATEQWPDVHMQPEETLQAFRDLNGRCLPPIHNGSFDLARHRWQDPLERISALANEGGVLPATPAIGEPLDLKQAHPGRAW